MVESAKRLTRYGVSRAEFIRQQLALMLEQYRDHPKPNSSGIIRSLPARGNERELFADDT